MAFARHEIESSLSARFAAVARRYPDQPALRDAGLEWTYRDLDRTANLVARLCPVEEGAPPVLLLLGHGALEIIALLAVLKSGRPWVALDPRSPPARLAAVAADAGADVVLTRRAYGPLAAGLAVRAETLPEASTLLAAVRDPALAAACDRAPEVAIGPDAPAAIVYTSGSTGAPKGVLRSQRSVLHRCWLFQQDQCLAPGERVAHLFSCGFVAAEVDVFGALLNGGTLCCHPVSELGFAGLMDWLAGERIALLHPPPALWRQALANLAAPPDLPALRTVFLAGEAVFRRDVECLRAVLPGCTVVHRLSSSEASVMAQTTLAPDTPVPDDVIPAGLPVPDKILRLVDAEGQEVAPGEEGEIVVESRYLAPGYWRRSELTATRYTDLPDTGVPPLRRYRTGDLGRFDAEGRLHHLGRLDEQVKVRGYRVEPREVEAALLGTGWVEAAVVLARPGPAGEKMLVACLVAHPGHAPDSAGLRARLAETLPEYMLPSRFEWRERLPITASGKIDRQALLNIEISGGSDIHSPPLAGMEASIARIWKEVLQHDHFDRHDDFFTVGGQSLLAAALADSLSKLYSLALPLIQVYKLPTIAEQAVLIQSLLTDCGTLRMYYNNTAEAENQAKHADRQ